MLDHAVSVIPAEPGYFALDRVISRDKAESVSFIKMPVIGWIIRVYDGDNDYFLEPVCTDAFSSYYHNEVLYPDGRVLRFGEEQWATIEEFESTARYEYECARENRELMRRRAGLADRA